MKVLVAGGTGALGRRLVPELLGGGHDVSVVGRSEEVLRALAEQGASPYACDVFDAAAVGRVLQAARPEVVIDELTRLPAALKPRRLREAYTRNDRIRWDGGGNVLAAAQASGARRLVVQSAAFWYAPEGAALKDERQPFFLDAPEPIGEAVRTMAAVEGRALASGLEVVILRYGLFYGPGTWYSASGDVGEQVRARRFPVIGKGEGVFSFVHVDDAARATAAALTGPPGTYNVVDDAPVRMAEWLPAFAAAIGAKPPLRVPLWLARAAAGRTVVTWMSSLRGASNAKARADLRWTPEHSDCREGFRAENDTAPATAGEGRGDRATGPQGA